MRQLMMGCVAASIAGFGSTDFTFTGTVAINADYGITVLNPNVDVVLNISSFRTQRRDTVNVAGSR